MAPSPAEPRRTPRPGDAAAAPPSPRSARGRATRERVLDAAAGLAAEGTWHAASVREIAARASASMSSLYHFFPDKDALLLALGERYAAALVGTTVAAVRPEDAGLPLERFFGDLIASLRMTLDALPGFAVVHDAIGRLREGAAVARRMEARLIEVAHATLAARYPGMPPAKLVRVSGFTVTLLHAVFERAAVGPDASALLAEAQEALVRYFAPFEAAYRSPADPPAAPTGRTKARRPHGHRAS